MPRESNDAAAPGPTPLPPDPLLSLMQLTDSALPTGAFSQSLGFETYMHRGLIQDEGGFARWLRMFVAQQLTFTDALAIRLVYAAEAFADVVDLDELATVQALPQQVRDGGITMGRRLLAIGVESYPGPWVHRCAEQVEAGAMHGHQAIVWAVLARELGIAEDGAVSAHVHATAMSLTQNAVRGIPLGQSAGQRIIRAAQEWTHDAVEASRGLDVEDLGAIAPGLEIAQMHHERQRARLFMS
ncbi:urease accessory protein UreF [Kocuria palustris]|uniref:urease accessory protein UreF n=1 Tax=Kocuria palustris TaxID=71999 RepID=UPI0011A6AF82|nr:urease accessory UreF family protein [Kocuria palustris]